MHCTRRISLCVCASRARNGNDLSSSAAPCAQQQATSSTADHTVDLIRLLISARHLSAGLAQKISMHRGPHSLFNFGCTPRRGKVAPPKGARLKQPSAHFSRNSISVIVHYSSVCPSSSSSRRPRPSGGRARERRVAPPRANVRLCHLQLLLTFAFFAALCTR